MDHIIVPCGKIAALRPIMLCNDRDAFPDQLERVTDIDPVCCLFVFFFKLCNGIPGKCLYALGASVFSRAEPESVPLCAEIKSSPNASSVRRSVTSRVSFIKLRLSS